MSGDTPKKRRWPTVVAVLTILGGACWASVVWMTNTFECPPPVTETRYLLSALKQAVQQHYTMTGEYPNSDVGLAILLRSSPGMRPILDRLPTDRWGRPFVYFAPSRDGKDPFELVSMGPDGELNTEDDIIPRPLRQVSVVQNP